MPPNNLKYYIRFQSSPIFDHRSYIIYLGSKQITDAKGEDMLPPSPGDKIKQKGIKIETDDFSRLKGSNVLSTSASRGCIVNISSPFKEGVFKDNFTSSPFFSKSIYQNSPWLKNDYWYQNTPGSNFGGNEQAGDHQLNSPFLGIKSKLEFDTPFKSPINQA